jgi:hypothetical protein
MIKFLFLLSILSFSIAGKSQTIKHTDLSSLFNYETSIKRFKQKSAFDSCIVKVKILNKSNDSAIQTIKFSSTFLFETSYNQKNAVRSYITGKNRDNEVDDNDFGDIIIADFNFDNKEDVAVKTEEGGNGGPIYAYFIQGKDGKFIKNKFLTDKMIFFPSEISPSKKILETIVHANAMGVNHNLFKLDTVTNKWKLVSSRFEGVK